MDCCSQGYHFHIIGNYEDARRQIVGSIVSTCCICHDVAWTEYYGNYVCRDCCLFFTNSVFRKAEYRCTADGDCEINRRRKRECHFCWLKCCFQSSLHPVIFGNGYMRRVRANRNRARIRLPLPRESFRQIREFSECLDWDNIEKSDFDDLPEMFPNAEFLSNELFLRYGLLLIIKYSSLAHGKLMLKRCFMDPFKCRVRSLQTLTIEMLEMAEWIEKGNIFLNLDTMKKIIQIEDIDIPIRAIWRLRQKLLRIEKLVDHFRNELVCHAQNVLQRW